MGHYVEQVKAGKSLEKINLHESHIAAAHLITPEHTVSLDTVNAIAQISEQCDNLSKTASDIQINSHLRAIRDAVEKIVT